MAESTCIFCKIARKENPNTVIEYESDTIVIFSDIKPATDFHFLAIPKIHIKNTKCLSTEHVPLLLEMKSQLIELIRKKSPGIVAETELSLGFHWPPFNSMNHLHMHGMAPVSHMRFIQRQIFKKDSFWYRQADAVIESLRADKDTTK